VFRILSSNLLQRKKHYIAVFVELVIVMAVGYLVMVDLIDWFASQAAYRKLGLNHVVYCTMQGEDAQMEEYAVLAGADYIGVSYLRERVGDVMWVPVTENYISCIPYTYTQKIDWKNIKGLKAVVPQTLSREYKLKETYTLELEEPVDFTVVGIVEDRWMFLPPVTGNGNEMMNENAVLLFGDQVVEYVFQGSNTYTLWFEDSGQKMSVMDSIGENPDITEIAELDDKNENRMQLELEIMGESILIFLFVYLLCCTAMVSHVLLSVIAFERKYRICYICGGTWWECVKIQVLTDALPAAIAVLISATGIVVCSKCFTYISWNAIALLAGAGFVMVIFVLSELLGAIRMREKKLMETQEEMYG